MPHMQKDFIRKHLALFTIVFNIFFHPIHHLEAAPWASPDDILVRHDLQILSDSGILDIPLNTWPIAWGDVAFNLNIQNVSEISPEVLLSLQRIRKKVIEEQVGGISANAEMKVAKNPDRIMTFFDPVNVKKLVASSSSYMSNNLAMNLKFEKTGTYQLLDESYISLARGNYSITLGSKKNWWGPGWMGSTVLSTNARPIRGLSIERNFSDPFKNSFLSFLGSWDFAFILGDIKNTGLTPQRRFTALRLGIRPMDNLEVGFSKSAIICDKNNGCGFSKLIDGVLGSGDIYDLSTLDYRLSGKFNEIPYATYGQISGTSIDKSVGIFGLETWGNFPDRKNFESYRVFTEFSSTTCGIFSGQSKYGCAYQNQEYPSAYHYNGSNIAQPLDGDSMAISFGGILVQDDAQIYKSTLAIGRMNRGSQPGYLFTKNETDFLNFNVGYQFELFWYEIPLGSFDVGLGFDIYKDKKSGSSEKEPRVYLAWTNTIDLSGNQNKEFSDYIDFIEADADMSVLAEETVKDKEIIDFVSFNERELKSIINIINDTALERGDTNFANYSPNLQSTNDIIDQLSQSSNDIGLSEYLKSMDETISNRN
jgi:hypothetical protein|tara:strand:+ start:513 stop:2291 length:1779 start_codon:yes stop_codon:yes gene_type:complete